MSNMEETKVPVEYSDDLILPVMVAVGVLVLTLLIFFLKRRFISRANSVLIVGLNDSGKTVLFSKLINKVRDPQTYSSLKENIYDGFLNSRGRELTIIDFPGAERLRKQLFSKFMQEKRATLKGLIFVVDSSTFSKKARDVAEFLYDVLYESGKKVPVLVACNKQDNSIAKSSQAIRNALEREFGMINASREAALESTDGDSKKRILTNSGKNFQWSDMSGTQIEFVECSAVVEITVEDTENRNLSIDTVQSWIDSL